MKLREASVESINFDVIYGLPLQTLESVETTFEKVLFLKPDMISFFSYAHLPQKMKNQKLIRENELPDPILKKNLYEKGKSFLERNGYFEIGMDHFTLPSGYLWKAKEEGRLERSFMGYTERKTDVLIGLGPSAISDSGMSFKQNHKDYLTYKEYINRFNFSIDANHLQSREDLLIQTCIKKMMCLHSVDLEDIEYLTEKEEIMQKLKSFVTDGLLANDGESLILTDTGKLFVRNVAMVFDQYLHPKNQESNTNKKVTFSQTI
jgi:coproporphyrinogen III oxidase-like Fe-S oxidoreductase